ncbi:hypothetical protein NP233_g4438 [Leucocoprinus birnbaumii]|uniref:DNA polymerase kappa n=1 Tax=Leucocoprinus birnbaumii TaxID=56174 RepID=A0AAD5W148_9AGAR|nr:hypothetical protein NP233_g4438 [Leucocoprinus birnbaumii]
MTSEASPHQDPPSQETASLVRRLAGPSSGKAGLAKDQSEINRIIAEVSKGSKFYENEKKKDKELTERINKVLKTRDDVTRGVDISKVEANVDRLVCLPIWSSAKSSTTPMTTQIAELESQRDLSQTIVHVDMDAFYASVELLNNPKLAGKPFGVGRGVLTTASYEARKYGVRSGMAGFVAKKLCPDLIFVSNHFSKYMEMSNQIMSIFKCYDPTMFPAGCDEGYLNITAYCEEHSISAEECVQEMRRIVFEETKLTVSAGIAPNKICSDKNKPNGQFQLSFDRKSIVSFMRDLSIRKVPGIGRVNERLLESIGIKTCGDIFTHRATVALMDKQFGLHFLLRTYLGIASNEVSPPQREGRKSIGSERTFSPMDDREKLLQKLEHIAFELETDMASSGWTGKTVTLKYKLDTYQVFTRAKSLNRYVSSKDDLFSIGKELFLAEGRLKLRLIGLRVTKLKDLRAPSPGGIKRFFEPVNLSPRKRPKLDHINAEQAGNHDYNDAEEQHTDAMPGYYEHEETAHGIQAEVDSEDEQQEILDLETETKEPKERPRPPISAPARPSSSSTRLEDMPSEIYLANTNPRPLGRERSRSDVGPRPDQSRSDVSDAKKAQTCPICSKMLMTDNQGLNAHIDFCLSRTAIEEARGKSTYSRADEPVRKPIPTELGGMTSKNKGWEFLMGQKDTLSNRPKSSKKRKK